MKAIYQRPSGFSDPRFYEREVEIIGYCYGYAANGQTALAVFIDGNRLDFAPVRDFIVRKEGQE